MNTDPNLLLAQFALQHEFISADALAAALEAWAADPMRPLGEFLCARGYLTQADCAILESLIARRVRNQPTPAPSMAPAEVSTRIFETLAAGKNSNLDFSLAAVTRVLDSGCRPDAKAFAASSLRYRPIHQHACGGLGEVYVAEDLELHRQVALKQIQQRHAADASSRNRFVLEAEITGRLEHPGIVPVYGLGVYADGRPYYAMRFIRGDDLKTATERFHANRGEGLNRGSDFSSLEFRQLLGRMISVCYAVGYAHSRGVLHRDLKPGNIMLGKFGETLLVDWGLAKIVRPCNTPGHDEAEAGESTLFATLASDSNETVAGSIVGTPGFMSPEQAAGKVDGLGSATDVYGLGATLYCLLTNKTPHARGSLQEMMALVLSGEPASPRAADPAVPAALDAVCQKAMAFRPEDRYPSALALAEDLDHWLADEPVSAHREPLTLRARRWMRKHRTLVTSAAVMLLVGLLALGVGLIIVSRLNADLREANVNLDSARTEALASAQAAKAREAEANAVLDFVEDRVFAAARPKDQEGGLGFDVKLKDALHAAAPHVETSFKDQPLIEARLRLVLGVSFSFLRDDQAAAGQFERARLLFAQRLGAAAPQTLRASNNLATAQDNLGHHNEALRIREETLAAQKARLGDDHPDTLTSMNNLAVSYFTLARFDDALKLHEQTLAIRKQKLGPDHLDTLFSMNNVADCYTALGRAADAAKLHEETLHLQTAKFGPDHPYTLLSMHNLATSLADLGRKDEALDLCQKVLAGRRAKLGEDHPDTLAAMVSVAASLADLGRYSEAVEKLEEGLKRQRAKLGANHQSTLLTMLGLAENYAAVGRHGDAVKMLEDATARFKASLGPDHALTLLSMQGLARGLADLERYSEALSILDDCLKRAMAGSKPLRAVLFLIPDRFKVCVKLRDANGCRATAEMWEKLNRKDVESLYNAACLRAVTAAVVLVDPKTPSADASKLAKDEADRAMAWLQKAVAAGYRDSAHLNADKDLDPLRDREDFKKLLAEVKSKEKK